MSKIDCKDSMVRSAEVRTFKDGDKERQAVCVVLDPPCSISGTELTFERNEIKAMLAALDGPDPAQTAVENLLKATAEHLIHDVYAVDIHNKHQLLVVAVDENVHDALYPHFQTMFASLCEQTGLLGVLVNELITIKVIKPDPACPIHGEDPADYLHDSHCTCVNHTNIEKPALEKS